MRKIFLLAALVVGFSTAMAENISCGDDGTSLSYTYTKRPTSYTMVKEQSAVGYITRRGNTYILGNQVMKDLEYSAFLRQKCPAAYLQYESGHRTSVAGWSLLGCGAGLCGLGWMLASGVTGDGLYSGVYMSYLGSLSMAASVPTLIVGYCRMHSSADTYNVNCTHRTVAYWSINMHPDGVGLALNF